MKRSILFLFAIYCLTISCKKEEKTRVVTFNPILYNGNVNSDSISYAIINYIDATEVKDSTDFYSQDIYTHSETVEVPLTLILTAEHTYIFKKFDLYDKSGNLRYYAPYYTDGGLTYGISLPFPFVVSHNEMTIVVIKK